MKILIADDESMVRIGLKNMLDELYNCALTYIEAKNGRELIQYALENNPAIAFVDIKMPVMDGLTAIREVSAKLKDIKWILLTGYSEFEYAKKAFSLGVFDYILKPIGIDELADIMKRASDAITMEQQNRLTHFRQEITSKFFKQIYSENKGFKENDFKKNQTYSLFVIYQDNNEEQIKAKMYEQLNEILLKEINSDLQSEYTIFTMLSGEFCIVLYGNEELTSCILGKMRGYSAEEDNKNPFSGFYIADINSIDEIYNAYERIKNVSVVRCTVSFGAVVGLQQLMSSENFDKVFGFSKSLALIYTAFEHQDEIGYKNAVNLFHMDKSNREAFTIIKNSGVKRFLKIKMGIDICTESYEKFIRYIIDSSDYIYKQGNGIGGSLISRVQQFIKENYMNDISINSIAEMVNLTPNYLSKLFHEATNKKFIDYICEIRISGAKKLLSENPDMSIKEVSEQVGYTSPRQFAKAFTRLTGEIPSKYKKGK